MWENQEPSQPVHWPTIVGTDIRKVTLAALLSNENENPPKQIGAHGLDEGHARIGKADTTKEHDPAL